MTCPKCQAGLYHEWVYGESEKVPSNKCWNCGYVEWVNHKPAIWKAELKDQRKLK